MSVVTKQNVHPIISTDCQSNSLWLNLAQTLVIVFQKRLWFITACKTIAVVMSAWQGTTEMFNLGKKTPWCFAMCETAKCFEQSETLPANHPLQATDDGIRHLICNWTNMLPCQTMMWRSLQLTRTTNCNPNSCLSARALMILQNSHNINIRICVSNLLRRFTRI